MIAGYATLRYTPAGPDPAIRYREVVYQSGRHYGVGPQPPVFQLEYGCPYCGGLLSDFSSWHFGQHWSCVLRSRALGERWAWISEEHRP